MPTKKIILQYQNQEYLADLTQPIDISMPLKAGKDTVNCYYADEVQYETIAVGDFVGSVAKGGSCNYQKVSFTPHGNGTHTECYGHLTAEKITIQDCLKEFLFLATLISVPLILLENGDSVITLQNLQEKLHKNSQNNQTEALIIRTLPNVNNKVIKQYSGTNPPYLQPEVCKFLCEIGVKHLLLDLPSVDKEWDNGVLASHREFWNLPARYQEIEHDKVRKDCTITELIFIADEIADGNYLLNLQIAGFESDASPSKPVIYKLIAR